MSIYILCTYVCMYAYIYIHICVCVCISSCITPFFACTGLQQFEGRHASTTSSQAFPGISGSSGVNNGLATEKNPSGLCHQFLFRHPKKFVSDGKAGFLRSIHSCKSLNQEMGTVDGKTDVNPLEGKQYENIEAEVLEGGTVGLITLNRPKALNALSYALMVDVVDALQTFDNLSEVRASPVVYSLEMT